jgi:hypothetical protein
MKWVVASFAALAIFLFAVVLVAGRQARHGEVSLVEAPRIVEPERARSQQPAAVPAPKAQVAAPKVASLEEEWNPADLPAVVAKRMHASKDKRAFFEHAMKMGGGAYLLMAKEVYWLCLNVATLGPVRAEQMVARSGDPQYGRRIAAHRAVYGGCDGFHTKPVNSQEMWKRFSEIGLQEDTTGRLYATMRRMWNPESHAEVAGQLREFIEIGDPYLLQGVGHRITIHQAGLDERRRMTLEEDVRRMRDEAAWHWALCELGKDCSPQSPFGQGICAARGVCDWQDLDEVAGHMRHPLGSTPGARERKDEIVAAIRARDWAKLGL